MAISLMINSIGILADFAMYLFLRKTKKEEEEIERNEPIPWKSGDHSETGDIDLIQRQNFKKKRYPFHGRFTHKAA